MASQDSNLTDVIYFIYRFTGYRLRNQLAALDFNHHRGRATATAADGQPG